ncbi:MAG: hypothetical protein DDT27_01651 [Dehalococcoidia bacterium]|nr:hypothetical protein [Chloroflexota bacterium]MBT9163082.1 hypothetical protein [Chloroflexota bacterium]
MQSLEVSSQVLLPGTDIEVCHPIGKLLTHLHGFLQLIIIQCLDYQIVKIEVWIFSAKFFKAFNTLLQCLDLFNCSFHGERKRVYRAFQALEEVDLHHTDKIMLTVALTEMSYGCFVVPSLIFRQDIF